MLAPENGNRLDVRDVVLIVTDGSSQDSVDEESKRLRDRGALVGVKFIGKSTELKGIHKPP